MTRSLGSLGALLAGLYVFYYFAFPTYTHRFRLTFQVEVDGKLKEGSGVITVYDQDNQWVPLTQKRWKRTSSGPSPWIDLGGRGVLLVSMGTPFRVSDEPRPYDASSLSFVAYFNAEHGSPNINSQTVRKIHSQVGARQLHEDQMPAFIWLADPLDPNSAQIVPPESFDDVISPSMRLVSTSVKITKDGPDNSLSAKLPWLAEMARAQFWAGKPWSQEFKLGAIDILGDR